MTKVNIDLNRHWMPFTDNRAFKARPRLVKRAQGAYYTDIDDNQVLDGSSGLFNAPLGHCRPEIAEAVYSQLQELDYNTQFNMSNPLVSQATELLSRLLPPKFNRLFFANSGSEAIDSALKMCFAYWRARGQGQKRIIVSRERAYHGMNFGGTALGGIGNNRRLFNANPLEVFHMRHTWLAANRFSRGIPVHGAELAEDLQRAINLNGAENIAACVVEPVSGSTGCLIPPQGYLEKLRQICSDNDILLVFDDVIGGFGRFGEWFSAQKFKVEPDLITMAKAITNGAIPMAAIALKQELCDQVIENSEEHLNDFFHGYTCSAHPVACAACVASLKIMLEEQLDEKVRSLSQYFEDSLFDLQDLPIVSDIRNLGFMAGIDLKPAAKPSLRGTEAVHKLFKAGLHVKATADCLIPAPPFIAEKEHIDEMCGIFREVLSGMKP